MKYQDLGYEEAIEVLETYDMSDDNDDLEFKGAVKKAIDTMKEALKTKNQRMPAENSSYTNMGKALENCETVVMGRTGIEVIFQSPKDSFEAFDTITRELKQLQEEKEERQFLGLEDE